MSHWWFSSPGFMWHRRRNRHGRNVYVVFVINNTSILLKPNEDIFSLMNAPLGGQPFDLSINFLDEEGKEVPDARIPDTDTFWTSSSPSTNFKISPDGLTATIRTARIGRDTVTVYLDVGRTRFSASVIINVVGVASVLTSVELVGTKPPPPKAFAVSAGSSKAVLVEDKQSV